MISVVAGRIYFALSSATTSATAQNKIMNTNRLSEFLFPLNTSFFFEGIWEKKYFLFEDAGVDVAFSVSEFEDLLNFGNLTYPQVRCYDSDSIISPQNYTLSAVNSINNSIDVELVSNLLFENKTVRIADLPRIHPGINELAKKISYLFGCQVNINSYFSRGPCKGLDGHYDAHHIFALQLYGEKVWNIGDVVVDTPTTEYGPKPLKAPSISSRVTTKAGQMLYLPPGMWHSTLTENASLHITIGIHPPRWSSVLQKLLKDTLIRHPIVRASIPMSINNDTCTYCPPKSNDLAELIQLIQLEAKNFSYSNENQEARKAYLPIQPAQFVDDELVTDFDSIETKNLINEIWGLSNFPCAIYFRGSFLKKERLHKPWDLDIYFIVNQIESTFGDISAIGRKLSEAYPGLPRIDLTIISKFSLFSDEEQILRRLLLVNDGRLVKGAPLKSHIILPKLNEVTARAVMRTMSPFFEQKMFQLKSLMDKYNLTSTEQVDSQTKTIAKAVLRTGVFVGIESKASFSREILICIKNITDEFPQLEPLTSLMLQRIEGKNFPLQDFIHSSERIKAIVYHEL